MKFLKILFCLIMISVCLAGPLSANILVIAENEKLSNELKQLFTQQRIEILTPLDINIDYQNNTVTTGENVKESLSNIINSKSIKFYNQLNKEYNAMYIITAAQQISKPSSKLTRSWGLTQVNAKIILTCYDAKAGRKIYSQTFIGSSSDIDENIASQKSYNQAIQSLNPEILKSKIQEYENLKNTLGIKYKITISGLKQKDYFQKKNAIKNLLEKSCNNTGKINEEYLPGTETNILRLHNTSILPDEFYYNLFTEFDNAQIFKNFDIDKINENTFLIKILPPDMKKLLISNVRTDWYHSRLNIIETALKSIPEIKDVSFDYIESFPPEKNTIQFLFITDEKLPVIEKKLWTQLENSNMLGNIKLVIIDDNIIRYTALYQKGDINQISVSFNNISPSAYRKTGIALDNLMHSFDFKNLEKSYDKDNFKLNYNFEARTLSSDIDRQIWEKLSADTIFNHIVQDYTSGANIGYLYLQPVEKFLHPTIYVKNLSSQNYNTIGTKFVSKISTLENVENIRKTYDDSEKILSISFRYNGSSIYEIEDAVLKFVKNTPEFKTLLTQSITPEEIVYYRADEQQAQPDQKLYFLYLKRIFPQDYKILGPAFKKLLIQSNKTSNLIFNYDYAAKTIVYKFSSPASAYDIDEYISENCINNENFKYIARGPASGNRIVYYYYDKSLSSPAPEPDNMQYTQPQLSNLDLKAAFDEKPIDDFSQMVNKLDYAVVNIISQTSAGPARGTGFFITSTGYILTTAENIKSDKIYVITYSGYNFRANIIKKLPDINIALLKIPSIDRKFPFIPIGDSSLLKKGNKVFSIAGLLNEDYSNSLMTGIISGLERPGKGLIQIMCPYYAGTSGSPVFDNTGKAIAIITQSKKYSATALQGMSFALPINYAKNILALIK